MAKSSEKDKGFRLYSSYGRQFEKLDDASAGQLIKAIFAYVNGREIPEISDAKADMAFSFICSQIDRDAEAHERKCEVNRQNAMLGGRPSKTLTDIEPEKPEEIQKPAPPADVLSPEQEERFTKFWAAYPRKTGKKAVRKAWGKLNPNAELFDKIMKTVELSKQSRQWKEDGGTFIPYPLTWLNQGRWDDEIPQGQRTDTDARRSPTDNPWKK